MLRDLTLVCVLVVTAGVAAGRYSGGTGEQNHPYRIATPNDLNDIGNHVEDFNKSFVMVNDINLGAYSTTEFNIIGCPAYPFTGVFDGNAHSIYDFTYDSNTWYVGLFSHVDAGQIKDVTMVDPNVDAGAGWGVGALVGHISSGSILGCAVEGGSVRGGYYVGALAGQGGSGTIGSCDGTAVVSGQRYLGGLLGYYNGSITNCRSYGEVFGLDVIGGLVGVSSGSQMSRCHSAGIVRSQAGAGGLAGSHSSGNVVACTSSAQVSGAAQTGGLIGTSSSALSNCFATGPVTGTNDVGGLVGNCSSLVSNCCATGTVTGAERIGGLIGRGGPIQNSYSSGAVVGDRYVGGLVGSISGETIENCYAAGSVNADTYAGGLAGYAGQCTVVHCYSAGSVSGSDPVGGFVGYHYEISYDKSFWDSDLNPDVNGIGNANETGVVGKTTAQMMTESTFADAGWDFVDVWDIGENQTYPFLPVYSAGDLNHDAVVNWADYAIVASQWLQDRQ